MQNEATKELFKALGTEASEAVVGELDLLARSLDRVGALTKTLVQKLNHDRLETCEPLLADAVLSIEAVASGLARPVVVDCKSNEVKIDRDTLMKFRPIFLEMLETLVEYCVESPKERLARKKRPKAYFQIDVKPFDGGYRLMVLCDGNGILPPLVADHGLRLADIGVRASFEGKPGQWSAWRFHIPIGVGAFHSIPVRVGERRLCIPSWAVVSRTKIEPGVRGLGKVWGINELLNRFEVDTGFEAAHGRFLIEVAAGTHTATYVFDEVLEQEEGFMKPLSTLFNGQGRFLGVVESENSQGAAAGDVLSLVLNPAYLVYGGANEELPAAETAASSVMRPRALNQDVNPNDIQDLGDDKHAV